MSMHPTEEIEEEKKVQVGENSTAISSSSSEHSGDGQEQNMGSELKRVESSPYPKLPQLVLILAGVALSIFLVALDMTIVATAIPRITDQFNSLGKSEAMWSI